MEKVSLQAFPTYIESIWGLADESYFYEQTVSGTSLARVLLTTHFHRVSFYWLTFSDAFGSETISNKFNDFIKFVLVSVGCSSSCYIWELNYELFSKFQLKVFYGNYANDHQSCEASERYASEVMENYKS